MAKEPCFHCDIKDLINSNADKYNALQVGEGLILALAEHVVLNTDYESDAECKTLAAGVYARALDVALMMKNSGEKIVVAGEINKGFVQ